MNRSKVYDPRAWAKVRNAGGVAPRRALCRCGCPVFVCGRCRRLTPFCLGAADDMPDACDECWSKAHSAARYRRTRSADTEMSGPAAVAYRDRLWRVGCLLPGEPLASTLDEMVACGERFSAPITADEIRPLLAELIELGWAEEVTSHG